MHLKLRIQSLLVTPHAMLKTKSLVLILDGGVNKYQLKVTHAHHVLADSVPIYCCLLQTEAKISN